MILWKILSAILNTETPEIICTDALNEHRPTKRLETKGKEFCHWTKSRLFNDNCSPVQQFSSLGNAYCPWYRVICCTSVVNNSTFKVLRRNYRFSRIVMKPRDQTSGGLVFAMAAVVPTEMWAIILPRAWSINCWTNYSLSLIGLVIVGELDCWLYHAKFKKIKMHANILIVADWTVL